MRDVCGVLIKNRSLNASDILHPVYKAYSQDSKMLVDNYNDDYFAIITVKDRLGNLKYPDSKFIIDERYVILFNGRNDHEEFEAVVKNNRTTSSYIDYFINGISPDRILFKGDFFLVVYDRFTQSLTCLRDHFGLIPFYYINKTNYFAFASEIRNLTAFKDQGLEIDDQWIADSISNVNSEKHRTPYKNVKRLEPGHKLVFTDSLTISSYWDLVYKRDNRVNDYTEAVEFFKELLLSSIKKRIKGAQVVGTELSGGLDSSGITALLKHYALKAEFELLSFTHAFSDESLNSVFPFQDEREFSKLLVDSIGIRKHFLCDADNYDFIGTLKNAIQLQSGPMQQAYSIFSDALYNKAMENNVDTLFSGFGGDEGVTSKAAGFFEEIKQRREWEIFRKEYIISLMNKGDKYFEAILKYFVSRHLPIAHAFIKRILRNGDWKENRFLDLCFDHQFGSDMNIKKRYYEMVGFPNDPLVRERQYKRIMHNHVSQRLEYSFFATKARGISYVYPLWDVDLIEFYYSLPLEYKYRNGFGRAIYRDALKGELPEELRLRTIKARATIPTVQQRFMRDYDDISALIRRSKTHNKNHYLDYDKMMDLQNRIKTRSVKNRNLPDLATFVNSIQILVLQEMEREGAFYSGIQF